MNRTFFIKNINHNYFKLIPIFPHIIPAPLYTFAIAVAPSLRDCSSSHHDTKSLTSSSALNLYPHMAYLVGPNR